MVDVPFGGLFQSHNFSSARRFDDGFRWDFAANDLNESAKALFRHLDRVFEILKAPDFVLLSTIELDVEAGRFPDVLAQYFRDDAWADTQSFFVAPIKRSPKSEYGPLGRLTFEAVPGQIVRVLSQNGGLRWGSALRVWGIQIPKDHVADALELSTDKQEELIAVQRVARAAWLAADDLDAIGLWLSSSVGENVRKAVASIQ